MKRSCLLVDDERKALEVLHDYVQQMPSLQLLGEFQNPLLAIDFLNSNPVDIVFLDITMGGLSGLKLPLLLNKTPLIIYTTAYPQYATESYENNAVDYLLKPISFDRFVKSVIRALELLEMKSLKEMTGSIHSESLLFIKSGRRTHQVKPSEILFLEKDGHYIIIHLPESKILSRLTVNEILGALPQNQFLQVHKSFIVALAHIQTIESNHIQIGKHAIPIGKAFRENLFHVLKSHGRNVGR